MESVLGKYFDSEQERFFKDSPDRMFLTIKNLTETNIPINLFKLTDIQQSTWLIPFDGYTSGVTSLSYSYVITINGSTAVSFSGGAGPITVTIADMQTALDAAGYGTWSSYVDSETLTNVFYLKTSQIVSASFTISQTFPGPIAVTSTGDYESTLFGGLEITGSVPYTELVFAQVGSAYKITRMWAQSAFSEQLLQPFDIRYTNDNGNRKEYFYIPVFDPYQNNKSATNVVEFSDFVLNADTIIANYNVLAASSITILLDYIKCSPDYINHIENPINKETLPYKKKVEIVEKGNKRINHWKID